MITIILVIITSGISIYAWSRQELLHNWMFNPYTIQRKQEYQRFILSGFIHKDWIHLLFNMFVLYIFGTQVEYIFSYLFNDFGPYIFLLLYLISIIVSDIPTYLKHRNNPGYNALGASGGVSAVLFAFILFAPLESLCLYGILCLPGIVWGLVYIIYSVYMGKRGADNINHDAHLWGALSGIVFCIIVYPGVVMVFLEQLKDFKLF